MKKESKWENTVLDLGSVKQGKKVRFNFVSNSELDIVETKAGCSDCTIVKNYKKEEKVLPVIFKAAKIPTHLKTQGYVDFRKGIIVYYKDGTKEQLLFKGRII